MRARRHAGAAILALGAAWLLGASAAAGAPAPGPAEGHAVAIFAGGCFWCMEPPFDAVPGVVSTTSGYTGGSVADPSYGQVSSGTTGHREAVRVEFDPKRVSYAELLDVFWHNIDPGDAGGQFCDRGAQYTSAIFYVGEEQRAEAEASKRRREASGRLDRPIVTAILPGGPFYAAEDYHQDYYRKNPLRYRFYRARCGRDRVLERIWGSAPH